jgi:hypothetical protein
MSSLTPLMQSLLNSERAGLPTKLLKKPGRKKALTLRSGLKLEKNYWDDTLKVHGFFTCAGRTERYLCLCYAQGEAPSVAEVDKRIQREYQESKASRTGIEPTPTETHTETTTRKHHRSAISKAKERGR